MEQEKIMTIHCASCGAPAQYDIVKQNYHCPNCGEDTGTEIPLKKLREFRSLTKTLLEQELPDSQTIACECLNCGARVIVKEHEVTETCIFCQSKILRSNVQMREGFPEMVIPFRLNRKQAEKQLDEWVEKHSDKKESEILKENRKKLKGIYLPYELIRGPIRFNVARDNSDRRYTCGGFLEHVAVNVTERCNNLLLNGMEPFLWEDLEPFQFGYIAGHAAVNGQTGKVSVLAAKETKTYPWVIEPLLGTLAVMIFIFFAFRNYGGVPMDPKELFELVGMAGLLAALILFTIFSKGREARVRRKIYKSISEEEKKNPGETMEPVFFEQIQGQEIPVRLGFYSGGRMVKIALILLLTNLSPSILAWLFTAVSCIGTGDLALLGQLDYSYNVVWLCLSLPVSVAGFVVFGRIEIYDSPVIFRILENGGRKRIRVKKENKKTLHMRWRTVRNTIGNWAFPLLIVLPLYAMTVYMIMNPYP